MATEEITLDELDYKILKLISANARISFLEVARLCDVSGASVHQRVLKLTNNGVISGSEFTISAQRIGYLTCAFVNLNFEQGSDLESIVNKLAEIPEVVECHHTTGANDIFIKVYAKSNLHLHDILQQRIKPLGMTRSESVISFRESFRRQVGIEADVALPSQSDNS